MYRRILVALDGSRNAEKVLPFVEAILRSTGGEALLLQVVPPVEPAPEAAARAYLRVVAARLRRRKIRAEGEITRGDAAVSLIRAADHREADLVAFTSHGRGGMKQWLFGSVAQKILRGCGRALLVVRAHQPLRTRIQRIVVPLDGSLGSEAVLPHGFALARAFGARVELLYVAEEPGMEAERSKLRGWIRRQRERMEERFRTIERETPDLKFDRIILEGAAAERIVERAEAPGPALVAMGSHGRTGFSRWIYGSVSEKVLQAVKTPVVIVRHTPS